MDAPLLNGRPEYFRPSPPGTQAFAARSCSALPCLNPWTRGGGGTRAPDPPGPYPGPDRAK